LKSFPNKNLQKREDFTCLSKYLRTWKLKHNKIYNSPININIVMSKKLILKVLKRKLKKLMISKIGLRKLQIQTKRQTHPTKYTQNELIAINI
jgi:hypothetical protein